MRKKLVFLLLILLFSSCIQENPDNSNSIDSKTFVDDFGYAVSINKTPERIISLAPSNTEILFALGLGNRVIAVTDYCNFPPEAKEKPKIGGYSTVNIEKVISLNPDLVIAAYGNGAETIEFLRKYFPVVALNPKNLSDVMRNIELLGKITGEEENASKIVKMMKSKIEGVKKRVNESRKVKVAHIVWHDPIWVSGKNTFVDEMITIAGGENAFDFEGWRIVGKEDLMAKNPDVIIVNAGTGMSKGRDVIYEAVMKMDLKAVEQGRVYLIDPDLISRPSYRLVYALEEIADYLNSCK
jgi:iron complex transport system substrate-binding protein